MNRMHRPNLYFFLTVLTAFVLLNEAGNARTSGTDNSYVEKRSWSETMAATRNKAIKTSPESKIDGTSPFFRPYDSGSIKGNNQGQSVSVNISGLKTLCLIAKCEEGTANCNIWGEPRLISSDGKETRLTDLKPTSISVGWGQMLINTNWQGHQLQIGDRKLTHGIWVHANSEIKYDLEGKYDRFEAFVGEDKDRANGTLRFKVLSGEPFHPPAFWTNMSRDYPSQTGWLIKDMGQEGIFDWLAYRTDSKLEQSLINLALKQVSPGGQIFKEDLGNLVKMEVQPGDSRWLELYGRVCRYRECLTVIEDITPEIKEGFLSELENMTVQKVAEDDKRWIEFLRKPYELAELENQHKALLNDIKQITTFEKLKFETFNQESIILAADRDPTDIVLRRTSALLADLKTGGKVDKSGLLEKQLSELREKCMNTAVTDEKTRKYLFNELCSLRRQIAFSNPLLDFDKILFIKRHRAIYNHMCDQFYGIAASPGGGLFILENAFSKKQKAKDVLTDSVVKTGRLKGAKLVGGPVQPSPVSYNGVGLRSGTESGGGSFLSPALSYDGKTILFAYVENTGDAKHVWHTDASRGHWDPGRAYHIFKVNVDGKNLQQLTDGTWNDFDPCWLPNGRIAFMTERRGGYLRCGRVCPLYNLFDMAADGGEINAMSFHESNEWNPSVTHDGRIIYTRWDYVDRHGCTAHGPWITTLDGTDSRSLHGNFAPRPVRPDMELYLHAIPGSHKYTALAAPHHGQAFGSLIILDPRIPDDDAMGPIKRVTPEVGFPESQSGREVYGAPWPLSENYYICVYDSSMQYGGKRAKGRGDYGIYLVDSFGNKELIYRDPDISCFNPIPVRQTPKLPVSRAPSLAGAKEIEAISPGAPGEATMAVVNVYDSISQWPHDTKIKELRILQLLPMSVPSGSPPHQTGKRLAEAGDSVVPCRWIIGTVPIEKDGSAYFTVPAYREVFFQALDEKGMAIQSMRSATYARNGERLLCQGCHEPKNRAPIQPNTTPLAMKRGPSTPKPDVSGSFPYSYPLLVQPVLDRNCVTCHDKHKDKAPNLNREPIQNKWYASYNSLVKYGFTSYGAEAGWKDPRWYRSTPGKFGAHATKLYEILNKGHHDVKLSGEDMHRLTLWLDCSSLFYGVFEQEPGEAQLRGEVARATLE